MRYVRIWLFCLALFCAGCLAAGWLNPAIAADEKAPGTSKPTAVAGEIQFEGRGEGFQPEPAKDECPSTFGPIVTDTAIPIEKGKFALQPTFGLSFTTRNFSPSWRRVTAEGDFKSFGMSLKFTYGLWNNLEVYAVIPYIHNWASSVKEPGPRGERAARFRGARRHQPDLQVPPGGGNRSRPPRSAPSFRHQFSHRTLSPPQSRPLGDRPIGGGGLMPSPPA